jgi:uncharacterized protein (TIGR02145 family)
VVVNQAGTINQNDILNLLAGWNLISLDVIPTPATPEAVFATLISASNLELVTGFQNQMGVFFDPAGLPFLNTLTGLVPGEGYWVKVTNETTLNVTGEVIPPTFAINIKAGWNLVAYWLDETTTPEAAFADLITAGKLLLVTGYEQGGKFYDPNGLPFLNTLTEIKNGFGYWVKMSGDFNGFSYPITWSCGDQLVDIRDGKTYETLPIGTQCWMKQNLNIGIRIAGTSTQTNNGTIEKYCYNNSESNCNVYGGLYQWNEMMQYSTFEGVQGICPTGWHVPTDAEWTVLSTYLGGETVAGGKMKTTGTIEAGTGLWYSPNTGATNESGFSGLPAGGYYSGSFSDQGSYSDFWSATQYSSGGSWGRYLDCSNGALARGSYSQSNGLSVRCLKD